MKDIRYTHSMVIQFDFENQFGWRKFEFAIKKWYCMYFISEIFLCYSMYIPFNFENQFWWWKFEITIKIDSTCIISAKFIIFQIQGTITLTKTGLYIEYFKIHNLFNINIKSFKFSIQFNLYKSIWVAENMNWYYMFLLIPLNLFSC